MDEVKNGLIEFYHFLGIISTKKQIIFLIFRFTAILSYDSEFCPVVFEAKKAGVKMQKRYGKKTVNLC